MQSPPSVYNTGAHDGLIMGLYLSAMFLLQAFGMKTPMLLIIGNLLMLGIPVITYFILDKGYRRSYGTWPFSGIWLHGIVMFLCGALIMALVVYGFLRFMDPDFVYNQLNLLIDYYNEIGTTEATEMAKILQRIIDRHLMPSAISIALTSIWFVGFFGAMLSMAMAFIIKYITRPQKRLKY